MNPRIIFHPVGAGHAVHIFTDTGRVIVIDCGASADFSPLEWLRGLTDRIDHLIISHPHGDHIQEIEKVSLFNSIGVFERTPNLNEAAVRAQNQGYYGERLDRFFEMDRYASAHPIVPGLTSVAGSAFQVETFYSPGTGLANLNNYSLVVHARFGSWDFMIPGDNEPPSWKALAAIPRFAQILRGCKVFLASHHGRDSGYCDTTFPALLSPRICIISDGEVQPTDATAKYRDRASGLRVVHDSGETKQRWCLTTRTDGRVFATLEARPDDTYLTLTVSTG